MKERRITTVGIDGENFLVNGAPTYPGRTWRGMRIEGLLMNSRMVQGIFDDLNPASRALWAYPDGPWDPDRNTDEFVAAMPSWRAQGLLSFTLNLQGGNPRVHSNPHPHGVNHPWHNSAFDPDGSLREDFSGRLERILDRADELGMAPIVGYFYFGQDGRLEDEAAVLRAAENATDWLVKHTYTNVLVEVANEIDNRAYTHDIIKPPRCPELVRLVSERSKGQLRVGASLCGGVIPPDNLVACSDFLLVHGNGVSQPDRIREMVDRCRGLSSYRGQPIVFNEDDHFAFEAPDNNMLAALSRHASWGLLDYRVGDEGFDEGYQTVPANWQISSERKRCFFELVAEVTGA